MVSITDPMGETELYKYDREGCVAEKTDRNGISTQFAFNMYGAPLYRRVKDGIQGESYQYTPEGRMKSALSAGMHYSYEYDTMGRISRKSASGRTLLTYSYDLNGNLSGNAKSGKSNAFTNVQKLAIIEKKGKGTKVDTEKDKLYEVLKKVEKPLSQPTKIWIFCLVPLVICMVFDAVPYAYWTAWIEKMFTYDIGNVIAIIVVIWTFTVSLSTYCLEKLGKRYYGIQMIDVLSFDLKTKGLLALAGMVLTELFSLILAAVLEWEITIAMIAIQQFFIMIYIFLMVCVKTSYKHILEQIKKEMKGYTKKDIMELVGQIEEGKLGRDILKSQPMLFKMVRNLDYTDSDSREALLGVLEEVSDALSDMITRAETDNDQLFEIRRCIIVFIQQITLYILQAGKTRENIMDFLYGWMTFKNLRLEIKQGITAALLDDLTPQNVSVYQSLMKTEINHQRELQIWGAVYNVHMQEYMDEEWRVTYTKRQFMELKSNWKQKDAEIAMGYWEQIYNSKETYAPLFKYIF